VFTKADYERIQQIVFDLVNFEWDGEIHVQEGAGLTVEVTGSRADIVAESKPALARAYFRLAQERSAGAKDFYIHEERQFGSCGAFLDFSRNGIMTVEACKKYMHYCAALGLNLIVLYTEDTYEVPEYPYMGYLRGKYSQKELRELDDYADGLGIELVPCIQTLGHMVNFLHWSANYALQDQPAILLADEEDTYTFLEAAIRSVRSCVRSKRIHIGMDEADGVGLGRYLNIHGMHDRFQLLKRHLDRVVKICEKYDFRPMMWSDMFYRLGSKTNAYYDLEAEIPQSVIENLPNVDMVYWDYYHIDDFWYEHMLTQHEKMGAETLFAGGIWTWGGFLPHVNYTYATMEPALKVCAAHKVTTVMATFWGDDGQETMHSLGLNQLPIFSEANWRPDEASRDIVMKTGEFLTGLCKEAYEAFGNFYSGPAGIYTGKTMIWCDLLYPIGLQGEELEKSIQKSEEALNVLSSFSEDYRCKYASLLFEIIVKKGKIMREMQERYRRRDLNWLRTVAKREIPILIERYRILREQHRNLWEREFKRNGWEVLALRYGAAIGRLEDVASALIRFANGELKNLCELDEDPMDPDRSEQTFRVYATPTVST